MVRDLIGLGADCHKKDQAGMTAFLFAALRDNIECLKMLMEQGCDINAKDLEDEQNAIVYADDADVVRFLLESGVALESRDDIGQTPLAIAARIGDGEKIKILLEVGADRTARDNDGKTPLDLALENGNAVAAEMLQPGIHPPARSTGFRSEPQAAPSVSLPFEKLRQKRVRQKGVERADSAGPSGASHRASRERAELSSMVLEVLGQLKEIQYPLASVEHAQDSWWIMDNYRLSTGGTSVSKKYTHVTVNLVTDGSGQPEHFLCRRFPEEWTWRKLPGMGPKRKAGLTREELVRALEELHEA